MFLPQTFINKVSLINNESCCKLWLLSPLMSSINLQVNLTEFHFSAKQYSHGNLLCGWRPSLYPSTETFRKVAFIFMDDEILWCNHSTFTWYHLLKLLTLWLWRMMLMMMMIIIINWKGYFSVNPILSFDSFLGKKSAVVNVVIAAKYL